MILKIMGVILVVVGCGSVGFRIANNHRKEEKALRQLIVILDFMECELQYHLTPLPQLCKQAAKECQDAVGQVFLKLAQEMEAQTSPNMEYCMAVVLDSTKSIPAITKDTMTLLGKSIGRFDLDGQLKGLESVRQNCRRHLEALSKNREIRIRSYQTLGICAGAALVIVLI